MQDTARKAILTGVLFFGGVCCAVFLGGSAQKKLQALIQEQFGDFFRAEWEKAFGPDMHTPEMCVDEPFLRTFHLLDGQWEECTVENFHEGDYRGVHFSAANVRLDHVYERGCGHEGYETCHEMVFKGLVLRCETQTPAPSPVLVRWEGRVLSRAVETDYGFAAVASNVDLRDLDALRRSYCASLHAMEETLDLLLKNTALFAARD